MLKNSPSLLCMTLSLAALIMAGLAAAFYLELMSSTLGLLFAMAVILGELYGPFKVLERFKIEPQVLNIYAHGVESALDFLLRPGDKNLRPDWPAIRRDLVFTAKICAVIFVPYVFLYYGYHRLLAEEQGQTLLFTLNFPPMLPKEILTQLLVVALPEELFYRGFLQGSLLKTWPNQRFIFGLPVGRAIILTNIIFALGHVISGFSPMRLLTFFPGLVFSWLVFKRQNLLPAIIFHAACNILGQILYASLFLR